MKYLILLGLIAMAGCEAGPPPDLDGLPGPDREVYVSPEVIVPEKLR